MIWSLLGKVFPCTFGYLKCPFVIVLGFNVGFPKQQLDKALFTKVLLKFECEMSGMIFERLFVAVPLSFDMDIPPKNVRFTFIIARANHSL